MATYQIIVGSPSGVVAQTVTPDPVQIPIVIPAPTIVIGAVTLAPDPVQVPIVIPDPSIVAGAATVTPDPVAVPIGLPDPVIIAGTVTLLPDPIAIPIVIPDPTITSAVTVTPTPVQIPIVIPVPTIIAGAVSLTPDPVAAVIVIPVPSIHGAIPVGLAIRFQEGLIDLLKADADLVAVLPEGTAGIREEFWRGTAFQYPCVRVSRPALLPIGNGNCTPEHSYVSFRIIALSKLDSSRNTQVLQGLIMQALQGKQLSTLTVRTTGMYVTTLDPVRPGGVQGETWYGNINFRTIARPK